MLTILDFKLTTDEQVGDEPTGSKDSLVGEISSAAAIRRNLGGTAARCVLVRPGRVIGDEHAAFARAAEVECWGAAQMPEFFGLLAELLGVGAPPASLKEAQGLVRAQSDGGKTVFASKRLDAFRKRDAQLNLEALIEDERAQNGGWAVYYLRNRLHVRLGIPDSIKRCHGLAASIGRVARRYGRIDGQAEVAATRNTATFCIEPKADGAKRLADDLRSGEFARQLIVQACSGR